MQGGEDATTTRISNGATTVNAALSRSGLGHISYRLVHVQRLSGNNTSTDLSEAIQEVGAFDSIIEIRDQHLALQKGVETIGCSTVNVRTLCYKS